MTCAIKQKQWTVYNALSKNILELSHTEFRDLIATNTVKVTGRYIKVNALEKIWIDGILNSKYFK